MAIQKFQVLIVGVGSIGERHLRCFQATGRAEVSLVEIQSELRQSVADRYHVARVYARLEEALNDPPDIAVVATPANYHIPIAQTLADAGVHLLIEKPLSTDFAGLERLQATVRERSLKAAVAYVYRCHPLLSSMRNTLREGGFGKPVQLIAVSGQHFPTYRPAYRSIYYNDRSKGGGAIQDALTHIVNAGEWLLGPIDRLVADAAHQVLEGVNVEDTVHLLARHGPVLASYSLNQHQAPNELTLTIVCERGTLRCEFHQHRYRRMTTPAGEWFDESITPLDRDTPFVAQANAFMDAVEGVAEPLCTLAEGEQTLRVNLAALASLESAAWHACPRSHHE